MKKIVLICSHEYSGSTALYEAMNTHTRIQGYKIKNKYENPLNFYFLCKNPHKLTNKSAIYMDELLYNYQLSTKTAYDYCRFIYVIRKPESVMGYMVANDKKKASFAIRYYNYRLRRLYEMSKRTTGAILLTYDDLLENRCIDQIDSYLGLKQPIIFNPSLLLPYQRVFNLQQITPTVIDDLNDTYERYLFLMRQNLVRINSL